MKLIVRTCTGAEYSFPTDDSVKDKTPDEAMDVMFEALKWSSLTTLKLGSMLFFVREIESLRFE